MKTRLVISLSALVLATTFVLATATAAFAADQETVLYTFTGIPAYSPTGGLISDAKGNLYGVTANDIDCKSTVCGSVFELSPTSGGAWSFSILYEFKGGVDGAYPQGTLVFDAAGNLYGTTQNGGGTCHVQSLGCGTVFKLTPNSSGGWTETVLHRFNNTSDGALLVTGVILDSSGNVYGTTEFGGSISEVCPEGCGTVFKLTPNGNSWTFDLLYTFEATKGAFGGDLVFDSKGNLYGTSGGGGIKNERCGGDGCGVVFMLTPKGSSWSYSVIYEFTGEADGLGPFPLIINAEGNLYGTALFGGSGICTPLGCGTVFELAPSGSSWAFSVLHTFMDSDGQTPVGITFDSQGDLYGTTENGGGGSTNCTDGCGTVYELAPGANNTWTETVLHAFTGGADGGQPFGGVILDGAGNIYGTTGDGGGSGLGNTFEITQ